MNWQLKIFLVLNGVPDPIDPKELREFLERFGVANKFEPERLPVGLSWGYAARAWLQDLRKEALSELTLAVATIGALAAIVAALHR